ncbi:UNVERIFIED_CONTAM: hypothetical protein NCL1_49495 [Trichonephila clavipes]
MTEGDVRARRSTPKVTRNDNIASSWQLALRWSSATGVQMSASSIRRRLLHRGLCARVPLYRANHQRLRLQWAHEHRTWQADWHQVFFSDESRFHLYTMRGAFVLDAMLVNTAFRSALSKWPNPWSYGLGCDFVSWTIQFGTY